MSQIAALAPAPDAAPRPDEAHADADLTRVAALSEAALRDAAALRHASTTPQTIALIGQAAETLLLAVALWGAAPATAGAGDAALALLTAGAAALAATGAGRLAGAYRPRALRGFLAGLTRLALAGAGLGALAGLAAAAGLPVGLPAAPALAGAAALVAARLIMAPTIDWCMKAGLTERRVVVVGGGPDAERLIRGLEREPDGDIRIVGLFDDRDDDRSPPLVAGARKLGGIAELVAFCRIAHVDMAIVALPLSARKRIATLIEQLRVLPIDIRLSCFAEDFAFRRRGRAAESGLIEIASRPFHGVGGLLKRGMDLALAVPALVALSPVLLAAAVAIKAETRGPVFFRQRRHGYNDQVVWVWKFRSMRHDQADPTARRIVTRDDPRVTKVGRFIRRTSIDELPQLFNVIAGEMSLVGPRPHAVNAVTSRTEAFDRIVSGYSARHRVKPGVTGLAQINGLRGEIDDPEKLRRRCEYDLKYIETWSLALDLAILLKTPRALLNAENAY